MKNTFNIEEHLYKNTAFSELVKDAVRFFNGSPVHDLPLNEKFFGSGVYALYYTGNNEYYNHYSQLNRLAYNMPIYVGKAVPKGWRQSRISDQKNNQSNELHNRLREHCKSIIDVDSLNIEDFSCRFVIFEGDSSDMISTIEAALIKINLPLWNSCVDGFGNHDPGKGRYEQARSDWDTLHTGRIWASRLKEGKNDTTSILEKIKSHTQKLGK